MSGLDEANTLAGDFTASTPKLENLLLGCSQERYDMIAFGRVHAENGSSLMGEDKRRRGVNGVTYGYRSDLIHMLMIILVLGGAMGLPGMLLSLTLTACSSLFWRCSLA